MGLVEAVVSFPVGDCDAVLLGDAVGLADAGEVDVGKWVGDVED